MRDVRYSTEAENWRSGARIEDHDSKRGFASMEEEERREAPQKVAAKVAATCSKQRAGGGSWTKGR
jgi:hypothetical protein